MSELNTRLEQFKKMAEADPENELGHFSLGRAYLDAGMPGEAAAALARVLQLNANISKAWQLLADAQLQLGDQKSAIETLTKGAHTANERGDMMPRNAMLTRLRELGAEPPEFGQSAAPQEVGQGQVLCLRCGQAKAKLPNPPFRTDQGRLIHEKICADCWREWIPMGTKVINELRLPLNDPQAQKIYDQHMMEFLNLR